MGSAEAMHGANGREELRSRDPHHAESPPLSFTHSGHRPQMMRNAHQPSLIYRNLSMPGWSMMPFRIEYGFFGSERAHRGRCNLTQKDPTWWLPAERRWRLATVLCRQSQSAGGLLKHTDDQSVEPRTITSPSQTKQRHPGPAVSNPVHVQSDPRLSRVLPLNRTFRCFPQTGP